MATESGSDVLRSNTAISCGTPLSVTRKSCLLRFVRIAPVASRTETSSRTRFTLIANVGPSPGDLAGLDAGLAGLNCPQANAAPQNNRRPLRLKQPFIPFPIHPN